MEGASFSIFLFMLSCSSVLMSVAASTSSSLACVEVAPNDRYIIYVDGPSNGEDLETFSINILVSVLGSEEEAKKALVHVYKYVLNGFSARLNPKQACHIKSVSGVLQVIPDRIFEIGVPVRKSFEKQLKPHQHGKRR